MPRMTGFFMPCSISGPFNLRYFVMAFRRAITVILAALFVMFCGHAPVAFASAAPKPAQLALSWVKGELVANVAISWQPPAHIKQVLERGVPLVFTLRATAIEPRWYWRDKVLVDLTRRTRVVYLPLTNQWRVSLADSDETNADAFALHQTVPTIAQAIALASNTRAWALGTAATFVQTTNTEVLVRFALDTTALPRPFQIGVADQAEWGAPVTVRAAVPPTAIVEPVTNSPTVSEPAPVVTADQLNRGVEVKKP